MNVYPFKNLVFEGGATLGVAYVGAMEELEKHQILGQIKRAGGASAGAINAMLFCLGYSSIEVWNEMAELDFNQFLDTSFPLKLDMIFRLFSGYGFYRGEFFKNWIRKLIARKTGNADITFGELKARNFRDLYLVGTNLNTSYYDIYSYQHSPDIRVADAVRISMSIPIMFAAVHDARGDVNVDGGVLNNYPVRLFDQDQYINLRSNPDHGMPLDFYNKINQTLAPTAPQYVYNRETLGFRLSSPQNLPVGLDVTQMTQTQIRSLFQYLSRLVAAFLNVQNNSHLETEDWHRTIYIDTQHINGYNFNMDLPTKERLVEAGRVGVESYFKWYDNAEVGSPDITASYPINKPDYDDKIKRAKQKNSP